MMQAEQVARANPLTVSVVFLCALVTGLSRTCMRWEQ